MRDLQWFDAIGVRVAAQDDVALNLDYQICVIDKYSEIFLTVRSPVHPTGDISSSNFTDSSSASLNQIVPHDSRVMVSPEDMQLIAHPGQLQNLPGVVFYACVANVQYFCFLALPWWAGGPLSLPILAACEVAGIAACWILEDEVNKIISPSQPVSGTAARRLQHNLLVTQVDINKPS
jgi:hypothetical protein